MLQLDFDELCVLCRFRQLNLDDLSDNRMMCFLLVREDKYFKNCDEMYCPRLKDGD
jgi:hypothetical protein